MLPLDNMVTEREDQSCASVGSWWWPLRGMCCSPALSKPPAGPYATLRSGMLGRILALCPGPVILTEGLWTHRLPPSASRRAVTQAAGAATAWRGSLRPLCPPSSGETHGFSRRNCWSGWHPLLQGIFPTRDQTRVSCGCCIQVHPSPLRHLGSPITKGESVFTRDASQRQQKEQYLPFIEDLLFTRG